MPLQYRSICFPHHTTPLVKSTRPSVYATQSSLDQGTYQSESLLSSCPCRYALLAVNQVEGKSINESCKVSDERQRIVSLRAGNMASQSYHDQTRVLMDQQRQVFEQERTLFAAERSLWNIERQELLGKIKDLEAALAERKAPTAVAETDGKDGDAAQRGASSRHGTFGSVNFGSSASSSRSTSGSRERFWEGPSSRSGSVASRTFSNPQAPDDGRLASILENSTSTSTSPTKAIPSGNTHTLSSPINQLDGTDHPRSQSVDVSTLEKGLDGIQLKAAAVAQAKIGQLQSPSPMLSPLVKASSDSSGIPPSNLSPPHNPNLTKHAGHTPNASVFSLEDSGQITPTQKEATHRPSMAAPLANRDANVQAEDPELKGPLGLLNEHDQDSAFLSELDSKLLQEARRIIYPSSSENSSNADPAEHDAEANSSIQPEPEVRLKFKRSINFGSAFGSQG
jgi:hypothetical protein